MVRVLRAATLAALTLVVAAGSAHAQQQAAQGPLRFAWLNSQAILSATPGRAEAESLFAREMTGARAEVARLQGQLDTAVAEFNRTSVTMSPAAKANRQQQLQQMEERNRQRAADLDQQMQQRESELTGPIMTRVNSIIEGIRAEFNYSFIFDVAAQPNAIVTADRALDITQLVIQRVQAAGAMTAPPSGAQPAPGGPPLAGDSTRPRADSTARPPAPPAGPRVRPRP